MRHFELKFLFLVVFSLVISFANSQDKNFEKAIDDYYNFQYSRVINGFKSFLNRQDLQGIKANYYTSMSYYEHGYSSEGLNYAIQASNTAVELFGENANEAAYGYIGYGKFYHEKQSYDTAELFYRAALELINGSDQKVRGEIYCNLAYTLDYNGIYDSALIYYKKAADIMEVELGVIHPYTDWIYESIPYVAQHSAQYHEQVNASLKSLQIKKELWGEDSENYVLALRAVAVAYEWLEDFHKMDSYAQKLLTYGKRFYGLSSLEYADYLKIAGSAKQGLLEYSNAINYFLTSWELKEDLIGKASESTLVSLDALADAHYNSGDYANALKFYEQYLSNIKKSKEKGLQIEKMEDVAQCLEQLSRYDEAELKYRAAMDLKYSGYENQLPHSYIALARIEEAKQQYSEAQELLNKAIVTNNQYNNSNQETYAFILNNRGILLHHQNHFDEAITSFNKSLEIRERLFGNNSREYAQTCNGLGNTYHLVGNNKSAISYFQRTYKIEIAEYGGNHPTVAATLVNMANCYSDQGQYIKANSLLEDAEKILEGFTKGHVIESVYSNQAINLIELAQFEAAETYVMKHHDLIDHLYGKESVNMAMNNNLEAMILHEKGDTETALTLYENSLDLLRRFEMIGSLDYASVLNNIGVANLDYQAYSIAQDYLKQSLLIYEKILPKGHQEILTTKMNLALVEDGKRNYQNAINIYEELLDSFKLGNLDSINVGTIYQNLAISQYMLGLTDQSISSTSKALSLLVPTLGGNNLRVAGLKNNLANRLIDKKLWSDAATAFSDALNIYKINHFEDGIAHVYLGMAALQATKGNHSEAISYTNEIIKLQESSEQGIKPVLVFNAHVAKVDALYQLYLGDGSLSNLKESTAHVKDADNWLTLAEQSVMSEEDRVQFSVFKSLLTIIGVKSAVAMYHETGDDGFLNQAFYYAEKSKSNVLVQSIQSSDVRSMKGIDQNLLRKEREVRTNIEKLEQEVFKLNGKEDQKEMMQMLSSRLFDQKRIYQETITQLKDNPSYRQLNGAMEIASIEKIQDRLSENEAVIEYAPGDSTLFIFIISNSDVAVFSKSYDEKFDGLVTALRNAIIFKSDAAFDYVSEKLYQLTLADVETYFSEKNLSIDKLTIVPEGPFNYFPFESLRRNGQYLIEDYAIDYSYSMTLSLILDDRESLVNGQLLAFAPVFSDQSTNRLTAGALDVFEASRSISTDEVRGFSVNGEFITPLPGTMEEVESLDILANSKGSKAETLVFDEAKEEVIKSGKLKDYQFIHFATHGFVNEAKPAYSGIFLSQNSSSDEDCVLFASEIYNLELNADLITLSACETGLGRFADGEGIVGLTRAFFYAGANNLMVSQWQVNDASTAKLMVDVYDGLFSGQSKSDALRNAKLKLIQSEEFNQPYYWAPFVLVGE